MYSLQKVLKSGAYLRGHNLIHNHPHQDISNTSSRDYFQTQCQIKEVLKSRNAINSVTVYHHLDFLSSPQVNKKLNKNTYLCTSMSLYTFTVTEFHKFNISSIFKCICASSLLYIDEEMSLKLMHSESTELPASKGLKEKKQSIKWET